MRLDNEHPVVMDQTVPGIDTVRQGSGTVGKIATPDSMTECVVRGASTIAQFDELEGAWRTLLEESEATVFQSFEWCRTWWKYYAKRGEELAILVFTMENEIVAIAPLFRQRVGIPGARLFSRLQFIGCGLSDYADVIVRKGAEQHVLTSLVRYLRATAREWDVFDVEDVNESSPVLKILPQIMEEHGLHVYTYQGNVCPRIPLPASEGSAPTHSYNFRRKLKKLQQGSTVGTQLIRSTTDDIPAGIDAFAAVHGSRWKSLGFWSAFDDARIKAFHTEVAMKFARRNWLRLYLLLVDGVPVATSFHFNYGKRIYMYQSNAHGPDAVMRCSPGYLIRALAIADGIREGMQVFDYLRGDEPYKYTEGDALESKNYLLRIKSPAAASQLRFVLFLGYELLGKCWNRIIREYYEYRRFNVIEQRSVAARAGYLGQKLLQLCILGYNFILRHSPIRTLRRFQILRKSSAAGNSLPVNGSQRKGNKGGNGAPRTKRRRFDLYSVNKVVSYFRGMRYTPRVLEERASASSGAIAVRDLGRERQLVINGETHSIVFTSGSWREARREYWGKIYHSPFGLPDHPSILLLGAGGGTTAQLISRDLAPRSLTVVDRDPQVIELAKRYFALESIRGIRILEGDASDVMARLQASGERFDLIIDDVYFSVSDAASSEGHALVQLIASLLTPAGSAALNRPVDDSGAAGRTKQLVVSLEQKGFTAEAVPVRQRWWNDLVFFRKEAP